MEGPERETPNPTATSQAVTASWQRLLDPVAPYLLRLKTAAILSLSRSEKEIRVSLTA